ncbi:MAG TPA: class I SAM-dependent methyltransferase [Phycisphaerales bacterium]|jgi:2-polyprenyl-3-methyl-5-hydroxy-6-metoxy-1,4-benzoquinol methylase|nr:class I SAM-dependent methyltransferase [Phycisphaerales bacterium]
MPGHTAAGLAAAPNAAGERGQIVVVPGRAEEALRTWSARELSRAAREMLVSGPAVAVRLQHLRPYICPFEKIMAHVPRGSRVLDVGCGRGLLLGLLQRAGLLDRSAGAARASVGFDLARSSVASGRMLARRTGAMRHLRFEHRDAAHTWPGGDGQFDVVTIVDVMHHVPQGIRRGLIRQAAARLRPGGRLIYKDMAARSWRTMFNTMHDLAVARELVRYTPVAMVEQWARDAGMRLEKAEDFDVLWYGHELRVFAR